MCGRFTQTVSPKKLSETFGIPVESIPPLKPRYNIAPSQPVAALVKKTELKIDVFVWGLIPSWAKDPSISNQMINARAETLAEKPSFRGPFKNQRCLVIADGFYEWKKDGKQKIPYYVRLKSSEPFTFAGLWSHWMSKDGSEIESCAIVTCEANTLMKPIHERMPVVISKENREAWLEPLNYDSKSLLALLKPYAANELNAYPVSQFVNDPSNNSPECSRLLGS